MPWPDPSRRFESAEDRELRGELRDLLGVAPPAGNFFGAEPTPELVALAEKLRAEAQRRRHTNRARPLWTLMAAALPIALVFGGVSVAWHQQKHRADQLAAEVQRKERDAQQAAATQMELARARQELQEERARHEADPKAAKGAPVRNRGLVIPVDRTPGHPLADTTTVKNPR